MTRLNRREFLDRSKTTALGLAAGVTILEERRLGLGRAGQRQGRAGDGRRRRARHDAGAGLPRSRRLRRSPTSATSTQPSSPPRAKADRPSHQGKEPQVRAGLPQGARRQVGRRGRRRHARPLARPGHRLGLPGRQGRLRREAGHATAAGKAARWSRRRGSTSASCRSARRTAAPPYNMAAKQVHRRGQARARSTSAASSTRRTGANFPAVPDSDPPAGFDWDMWNGPAPEHRYNATCAPLLASPLALLRRRHRQRRHPPDRPGPLALRRRLSRSTVYSTGGRFDERGRGRNARHAGRRLRVRQPA